MNTSADNQIIFEDRLFICYLILLIFYLLLFMLTFIKIVSSIKGIGTSNNAKVMVIDSQVFLLCLRNVYTVRIAWLLNIFDLYEANIIQILEALCSATLNFISATFILLWIELYYNISIAISSESKARIWKISLVIYAIFIAFTYSVHIFMLYSTYFYLPSHFVFYSNISLSLVVIFTAIYSGVVCIIRIVQNFSAEISKPIAKKLKVIIASNTSIYILNLVFVIIHSESVYKGNTNLLELSIIIFLFFFVTEVLPLFVIIYYFRPEKPKEKFENSCFLPSFMEEKSSNDSKLLKKVATSILLQYDSRDLIENQKRNNSLITIEKIDCLLHRSLLINESDKIEKFFTN